MQQDIQQLFWADQIAKKIIERKKFHFIDREIPKLKEFTVKTSASLSGVLHIGRLSDTIRGCSVFQALKEAGVKTKLIWVAEDMDPFRKVPGNLPLEYKKYLGLPVTDVPDPEKCHKNYAEHFKEEYLKVIDEFATEKIEKLSMRDEYKKGSFNPFIKKIVENTEKIIEIQNKFRKEPLENWYPWKPICKNCGKIATTKITGIVEDEILYKCEDYNFKTTTAKGCNHSGTANPLKDKGKLMWKSEWAAGWALWKVATEGAGKEYQVPGSAFWINAEIAEKILGFPMPEPIFYEHIMIDNVKMSASLGNVVYPKDWLEVAPPELLRFFYNKRLMKTRSFSWKDLPVFYNDYDFHARAYYGKENIENKKELSHMKRLYEISDPEKTKPIDLTFAHATVVAQIYEKEKDIVESLKKTGQYSKEVHNEIFDRIKKAKTWLKRYAPDEFRFELQKTVSKTLELDEKEKTALKQLAELLQKKDYKEEELSTEFYSICKKIELDPKQFYRAAYKVLLNKEQGPRLAGFILAIGKEKVIALFEKA